MKKLRYIVLDEFDENPLRAFADKSSALHFLESRPNCKLKVLPKEKTVPITDLYEECLF